MQGNSDGPTDGKFKYAQVSFEREEEGGVYMMSLTGSSAEMVSFEIFETKEQEKFTLFKSKNKLLPKNFTQTNTPVFQPERLDFRAVADNGLSILWQLPQLIVITIAEILFSITVSFKEGLVII